MNIQLRLRGSTVLCALLALGPRPAFAQSSDADAVFRRGLDDMRAGHYATACPAIEQSYKLDPMPGALFTLAECDAAWGKSATAMARYQEFLNQLTSLPAVRRGSFDERRGVALAKISALGAIAPVLEVDLAEPETAPADLLVRRDGELVPRQSFGVSKQVDPGEYVVSAELHGQMVWQHTVRLADRDRARVVVPASAGRPPPAPKLPKQVVEPPAHQLPPSRTPAYLAAGVGAAGLIVGSIAGIVAMQKKADIADNCVDRLCSPRGHRAVDAAKRAATISTVGFITAAVGTGAAGWLWFSRPTAKPMEGAFRPSLDLSFGGDRTIRVEIRGQL